MINEWVIVCWILAGLICSFSALQHKRNPYGWFFIGLIFGVFGILFLYLLNKKFKKEKLQQVIITSPAISIPESCQKLWYYLDNQNQQIGPMSFSLLKTNWIRGKINSSTFLWNAEMENWKQVHELPEIFSTLKQFLSTN